MFFLACVACIIFIADFSLPMIKYISFWPVVKHCSIGIFVFSVIILLLLLWLIRKENQNEIQDEYDDEEFFIADDLELCLEGKLACIQDKDAIISFMKKTKSFQFQPDQGFYFFDHDTTFKKKVEIKDYLEAMLELTSGKWESVLIAYVPPFQHEGKTYSIQNGKMVFSAKGSKTCEHVLLYPDW